MPPFTPYYIIIEKEHLSIKASHIPKTQFHSDVQRTTLFLNCAVFKAMYLCNLHTGAGPKHNKQFMSIFAALAKCV